MGTLAAPNVVLPLINLSTGALDDGETVEIVLHGEAYPGDVIALTEIASSGYYKKETAGGTPAVTQGIYEVYVGTVLKGLFVHGYTALQDHLDSTADPHSVAAAQVSVVDSGAYFAGADVEAVLQEIGADLATKADAATALLLDNSSQSVATDKPKVSNLDADHVDGHDAGVAAGNVLVLDANGEVPLANIPATLTAKDADTVDGKHVGTSAGTLPELSGSAEGGKVDTTLLGKEIGSGDDDIPVVHTSVVAGKLHSSMLGKANPLLCGRRKEGGGNQTLTDQTIQYGFHAFVGDDASGGELITITFPTAFDTAPFVIVGVAGQKVVAGGAPTTPEEMILMTDTTIIVASTYQVGTTTFKFRAERASGNWDSAYYYGFTWIAIGTDTTP